MSYEAVEAAAEIVYRTSGRKRVMSYEQALPACMDEAREILEAAAQYIAAEALEEAAKDLAFGFGPINQRRTDEWLNARAWKLRRGNQVKA